MKPFKSRKTLARELQIHPKTLSRYMRKIGFKWDKTAMPPIVWEKLLAELNSRNSSETELNGSDT
jgi:hypothetical protein